MSKQCFSYVHYIERFSDEMDIADTNIDAETGNNT